MTLLFWGLTVSVIGKVLLAVGVLMAHGKIVHEHRIDMKVLKTFKVERWLTILGLALMVIGYILELAFYGFTPFIDCGFENCAANTLSFIPQ
ncbi:MAG: hypothetical protein KDD03_00835 [Gelidibacter sp.]|nr:hypothetical protein [Gelidibacter sp.]